MKDTLWLIRKTLISTFKNQKNWFLYFGLPALAITLAFFTRSGGEELKLRLGIVNEDAGQAITLDMVGFIEGMGSVALSDIHESEVDDRIVSGKLDAAVIFPSGFAESLKNGSPLPARIVSLRGAEVTGYVKANLDRYIDNQVFIAEMSEGDPNTFDRLYAAFRSAPYHFAAETVKDQSAGQGSAKQSVGYLLILMLFGAANLSGILIKERENRTFYRLISSPVSARTYVLSNIIVNMAVLVLQIAAALAILKLVFRIDPGIPSGTMFLLLGLFALVAVSLSLAITAFSKSSSAASSLQNMLYMLTSILAGCMFPVEVMPEVMRDIASLLPQYWLLETIGGLQSGESWGSLYPNLLILSAFALTFFLLAVYRFARNNDTRSYI